MITPNRWTSLFCVSCLVICASGFAGCSYTNPLDQAYDTSRPDYTTTALPNPGPDAPVSHIHIINADPSKESTTILVEPAVTGTWTFTAPPTTTTHERKNADLHQFSIYQGQPAPTDTPIVVITVTPDPRSLILADPATYKVSATRTYVLNGNIAKESIGHTNTGAGFTELILTHPGAADGGDQCHAIAVAKNSDDRKTALDVLGSIVWKPSNP